MANVFKVFTKFMAKENLVPVYKRMGRATHKFAISSEKSFERFAKAAKFGTAALVTGAGAATAALGAAVMKTAEAGDEAAKTSRRLGITAEALQELRFAADRQGVSASLLDSSFTALQKRVGELKAGTGSLFSFLKKKGDDAFARQLFNAKNTGEAFELLTKKMATIKDPMEKAAFASAAFSRAGVDMLKFMEAGVDGIDQLRGEARKYGAVISNEAAGNSELFIDAITNLKASLAGIGFTIASKIMPTLTKLIQGFADFWAANRKILTQNVDKFFTVLMRTAKALKPVVFTLFGVFKKLFDFIMFASPFLKPFVSILLAVKGAMILIGGAIKAWIAVQTLLNIILAANPIGLLVIGIAALIAGIVVLVKNWDKVTAAVKRAWTWFQNLLDNPLIAAAATIFAPFIAIPALIMKHWEPIKTLFNDIISTALNVSKFIDDSIGGFLGDIGLIDPPNQAQAEASTVNVAVENNISGVPNAEVDTKVRRPSRINMSSMGMQVGL